MSARLKQEDEEILEQEFEEEYESSGSRIVPITVLLIAVAGFVSLGWYAYKAGSTSVNDEDLLVVEADATPMKEAPLDPGGMQFPHQDKTIFETISSSPGAVDKPAEKVMPGSEQPIATLEQQPDPKPAEQAAAPTPPVETVPLQTATPTPPVTAAEPTVNVSALPGETVEAPPPPAPTAQKKSNTKIITIAPSSNSSGSVQLGAFRSNADAEAAWKKLAKLPALAGKKHSVVKADLGSKGVFYRLRASGVDCAAIAGKAPCMAVK